MLDSPVRSTCSGEPPPADERSFPISLRQARDREALPATIVVRRRRGQRERCGNWAPRQAAVNSRISARPRTARSSGARATPVRHWPRAACGAARRDASSAGALVALSRQASRFSAQVRNPACRTGMLGSRAREKRLPPVREHRERPAPPACVRWRALADRSSSSAAPRERLTLRVGGSSRRPIGILELLRHQVPPVAANSRCEQDRAVLLAPRRIECAHGCQSTGVFSWREDRASLLASG